MKSSLAAVKRQRFPARASWRVLGLFILGLGRAVSNGGTLVRGGCFLVQCDQMAVLFIPYLATDKNEISSKEQKKYFAKY